MDSGKTSESFLASDTSNKQLGGNCNQKKNKHPVSIAFRFLLSHPKYSGARFNNSHYLSEPRAPVFFQNSFFSFFVLCFKLTHVCQVLRKFVTSLALQIFAVFDVFFILEFYCAAKLLPLFRKLSLYS